MVKKNLLIILGNQLFPLKYIKNTGCTDVFMSEDYGLCREQKHHKLKILMFFLAMREYRNNLKNNGFKVHYHSIEDRDFKDSFEKKLSLVIKNNSIKHIHQFELVDSFLKDKIKNVENVKSLSWTNHKNPMFILSKNDFKEYGNNKSNFLQAHFYKYIRKRMNILLESDGKPSGGKWSFDDENRKKITKDVIVPKKPNIKNTNNLTKVKEDILKYFSDHPGNMDNIWFPTNRKDTLKWFEKFLQYKFNNFGHYEDAIIDENNFLFHSNLSPMMNMGLITPDEIISIAYKTYKKNNIPLNSFEGFIRQIIGWREFIKGINDTKGKEQLKSNFWNHNRKLTLDWYQGTTGIKPLDDTIKDCINYGYTHHIPRLMILSNIMTLSRINPNEIYKWFMEMFIDSSEWVMIPNVYGMGTFSDGGIFSTKPYLCGSNYILKMSNYKKGNWCEILDGLYWKFINDNLNYFKSNPRLSIMNNALGKIKPERRELIFSKANEFINKYTTA
ncbi:MAG: (6-4) photolyase [Alphaproteobacteria bacterium MarineAlpha9_Bin3]|nr:MAG: (6-4) photolyase [Alphaproteobacteria bacterium MarineAlpha9_Bin3]|tara:strand:- start:2832 stop:4331 length:1500 start_codon:yes stop_codon:yes gene_type:complete